MKLILFLITSILFAGCVYVSERGISTQKYDGCKEVYDSMGFYHYECPDNVINYDGIKNPFGGLFK